VLFAQQDQLSFIGGEVVKDFLDEVTDLGVLGCGGYRPIQSGRGFSLQKIEREVACADKEPVADRPDRGGGSLLHEFRECFLDDIGGIVAIAGHVHAIGKHGVFVPFENMLQSVVLPAAECRPVLPVMLFHVYRKDN